MKSLIGIVLCLAAHASARLLNVEFKNDNLPRIIHGLPLKLTSSSTLGLQLTDDECKTDCNGRPAEVINNHVECWGDFSWSCTKNESRYKSTQMAAMCSGHFFWTPTPSRGAVSACEGLEHFFLKEVSHCPFANITKSLFKGEGCLGTHSSLMEQSSTQTLTPTNLPISLPNFSDIDLALDDEIESIKSLSGGAEGIKVESRCSGKGGAVVAVSWKKEAEVTSVIQASDDASPPSVSSSVKILQSEVEGQVKALGLSPGDSLNSASSEFGFMTLLLESREMDCELTCNDGPAWLKGLFPCWGKISVSCKSDSGAFVGSCRGLWTGVFGKMCIGLSLDHSQRSWKGHPDNSTSYSDDNFNICSGHHGIMVHRKEEGFAMGVSCHGRGVNREITVKTTEGESLGTSLKVDAE